MSSDTEQPLALLFDQTNKVLLAIFTGVFTRQITIDLDTAARALAAHHGPFAVVLDFTRVTALAIQLRDWPQFATNRRAIRGTRRIMVAPKTEAFVPLHLHAPHHGNAGEDTDVVATRAEAFGKLGLRDPRFEPVGSDVTWRAAPGSRGSPRP